MEEGANATKDATFQVEQQSLSVPRGAADEQIHLEARGRRAWKPIPVVVLGILVIFAVIFSAIYVPKHRNSNTIASPSSINNSSQTSDVKPGYEPMQRQTNETKQNEPFNVSMSYFSENILSGYSNNSELSNDIEKAALFMLNQAVEQNIANRIYLQVGGSTTKPNQPSAADNALTGTSEIGSASKAVGSDVNDYGTNNQENQVEEGDVIVSDGVHGKFDADWKDLGNSCEVLLIRFEKFLPLTETTWKFGILAMAAWLLKSRCPQ